MNRFVIKMIKWSLITKIGKENGRGEREREGERVEMKSRESIPDSGNLSKEKTFMNWLKNGIIFREKLLWIAHSYRLLSTEPSNRKKTYTDKYEAVKFTKVFSLEKFRYTVLHN